MAGYKPEILIFGAGAIGAFYGAKLAQAGADVSTVCRSNFINVKENGFSIKSPLGDFIFKPKQVVNNIENYNGDPDYIIVTTKVLPEINIPKIILPAVKPDTSIVLLQNGIKIEGPVLKAFPKNEIISGLAFVCLTQLSSGHITHHDYGKLAFGLFPEGVSTKTRLLCDLFRSVNITCELSDNIERTRWKKLVWNAPFNPVSVIGGGINTKQMLDSEPSVELIRNVMKEVFILAEADNCNLNDKVIESNIDATLKMTPYKTSMLLDYENSKKMEVEAILGNAVRFADKKNIRVPYLKSLYALLYLNDKHNL
ncbi:MAG: 2-dehydropantoate 2-reductase [bacterium]|nr:2-dehydropantoate 2-reductase [bacterium]